MTLKEDLLDIQRAFDAATEYVCLSHDGRNTENSDQLTQSLREAKAKLNKLIDCLSAPAGHFVINYGKFTQIDADCWPNGSPTSVPLFSLEK